MLLSYNYFNKTVDYMTIKLDDKMKRSSLYINLLRIYVVDII